jgi:hypothetical protein
VDRRTLISRILALPALAAGFAATTWARRNGLQRLRTMASRDGGLPIRRADALADLDHLQDRLETRFSYLHRRGVDHRRALAGVRDRLGDPITLSDFRLEIARFLALFDDGHAQLHGKAYLPGERFLPFLLADTGGGIVAGLEQRQGLVDPAFPFVTALDGVAVGRWIDSVLPFGGGSPQWRRRGSLAGMSRVQLVRRELGLPHAEAVRLELSDAGGRSRELTVPLAERRLPDRRRGASEHRILPGNVGHIRIAVMDDRPPAVTWLLQAMQAVRSTEGLILDIRDNGGGSRLLLRLLFTYFLTDADEPHIGNVARHRLAPDDPPDARDGYLGDRFLYPRDASVYTAEERAVIDRFAARFEPEWSPPAQDFSQWHYLLLTRRSAPEGAYRYDRPVVLLVDAGTFSASDVFAGSFKGFRDVTLLGAATGGGSGRARSFELPRSQVVGRFSTMASFQPSGLLYDGRGVEPDVSLPITVDDWLGRTDTVLEAARRRLVGS